MPALYYETDELYHYGVPGMKWGVRRGNASKAFAKSSKKLDQLNKKSTKTKMESAKLEYKSLKKEIKASNDKQLNKARKLRYKSTKLSLKSAKLQKKALKWEKSMSKVFSKVSINDISPEHLDVGKKYTYMLMKSDKGVPYYETLL